MHIQTAQLHCSLLPLASRPWELSLGPPGPGRGVSPPQGMAIFMWKMWEIYGKWWENDGKFMENSWFRIKLGSTYIFLQLYWDPYASDIESYITWICGAPSKLRGFVDFPLGIHESNHQHIQELKSYGVKWQDPRCYFDEKTMEENHGDL